MLVGQRHFAEKAQHLVLVAAPAPQHLVGIGRSGAVQLVLKLEANVAKTGVPRAILGDHGSDLAGGVKRFRQAHPETANLLAYAALLSKTTPQIIKQALESTPLKLAKTWCATRLGQTVKSKNILARRAVQTDSSATETG